jgi:threonine/homoserine/homoserine lactone efflux protein
MEFVLAGLGLGLGAGLAPGPLMALVITTTLAHGLRAGARVAFSPLLTDLLVIATTLLLVASLPARATAGLGVVGGLYVVWLGIEALRDHGVDIEGTDLESRQPEPLRRGAVVNLLSPHPWLFWATAGAPLLVSAADSSWGAAAGFLLAFYAVLIGSKLLLAVIVAGGRERLSETGLRRAHRLAAAALLITGVLLALAFAPTLISG